jgi:hypothetical protein
VFTARYGLIAYIKQIIIWEQTAAFAVYGINWLVFIAVVESVYSAVRTDSLYKADNIRSLESLTVHVNRNLATYKNTGTASDLNKGRLMSC